MEFVIRNPDGCMIHIHDPIQNEHPAMAISLAAIAVWEKCEGVKGRLALEQEKKEYKNK